MPTYFKASSVLLSKFNQANGTSLTSDQVEWGIPMPAEQIDPAKALNYNTAITLKMLPSASRTGSVTLFYNRIDLAREFASFPSLQNDAITVTNVKSTRDLATIMELKLGLRIKASEIVDHPINLKNDYVNVEFQAMPESMEYIGGFILRLYNGTLSFSAGTRLVIGEVLLDARASTSGYTPGETDYAGIVNRTDYTPIWQVLSTIAPGEKLSAFNSVELDQYYLCYNAGYADVFKSVDNIPWVYNTADTLTAPNIFRANFLWNGSTSEFNKKYTEERLLNYGNYRYGQDTYGINPDFADAMADERYDNVLVLIPNWPWSASKLYRSVLFFHYNLGDPNDFILRYR